jgi:hypothetical protein
MRSGNQKVNLFCSNPEELQQFFGIIALEQHRDPDALRLSLKSLSD